MNDGQVRVEIRAGLSATEKVHLPIFEEITNLMEGEKDFLA